MSDVLKAAHETVTVFDVDRTLVRGPTTVWAFDQLYYEGLLDEQSTLAYARLNALRSVDPMQYISKAGKLFGSLFDERPLADEAIADTAERAANHWKQEVFEEMWPELEAAQKDGPVLLVSHGPDVFIKAFARALECTAGVGRSAEHYTAGKLGKLAMAAHAHDEIGVSWNPARLRVYGDSPSDMELLRVAEQAVLVNPMDPKDEEEAMQRQWRIIRCAVMAGDRTFGDFSPAWLT